MPSNYSFRCLKETKKNLDIVIRHLLWKLVQECEEFPVNQARTKVYSALCHGTSIIYVAAMERFKMHKKVRRIMPALDMCYTLQLVNDRNRRSQSKFKKRNLWSQLLLEVWEFTVDDMKCVNGWLNINFVYMVIWNTDCVPVLNVAIINIDNDRLC